MRFCVIVLAWFPLRLPAQSNVNIPIGMPDPKPYTLHVYANSIQIPTLTLTKSHKNIPGLTARSFDITLDHGPKFHPTMVKTEGDSPISLGILLDVSGPMEAENDVLRSNIAALATHSFLPHDHVSVFGVDCKIIRTLNDAPATADNLQQGVDRALWSATAHDGISAAPRCATGKHLWDSIAGAVTSMAGLPGYRVLLVITDGQDFGSLNRWSEVQRLAVDKAVTVFAICPTRPGQFMGNSGTVVSAVRFTVVEDPLDFLCGDTGGLVLEGKPPAVADEVPHVLELVRNRYILVFPRPSNESRGAHYLDVKISQKDAIVRPAGVGLPLPDPSIENDPSTVPSNNSNAPKFGNRRPLPAPQ
ncbi:MAG TPA: hypothetical protein VGN16_17995 [Acidobacteriaceae bacterium]|jgi:hypothetical protein